MTKKIFGFENRLNNNIIVQNLNRKNVPISRSTTIQKCRIQIII